MSSVAPDELNVWSKRRKGQERFMTFSNMSVSTRHAQAYHHASDIPEQVWRALSGHQAAANVILPFARKALSFPHGGDNEQLWIALYDDAKNVEFVLSCTKGPLGNYPIFIVVTKSPAEPAGEDVGDRTLTDSLSVLVHCLLQEVPPQRVFSVFSIANVSETFARIFVAQVRARGEYAIEADETPYYDATFTFCTAETLNASVALPPWEDEEITIALQHADTSHVEGIRVLCKAFSETSPPYELDDARARLEAETIIANHRAWVHMIQSGDREPEVACLVAATRESDDVTAITKVYTAERWQSRGCAGRLLRRVCQEILAKKARVVLYVGNGPELAPARKLYHKTGFQGLRVGGPPGQHQHRHVEGVERWVEIGFKGTDLGYW